MKWIPKTRIGKLAFWMVMLGLALLFIPYWIAMILKTPITAPIGFLSVGLIVIFGITSAVAIIKYKDRAILLFISSLFGLLGILLILGEFLFTH